MHSVSNANNALDGVGGFVLNPRRVWLSCDRMRGCGEAGCVCVWGGVDGQAMLPASSTQPIYLKML
mgnify:CR=1 FL=1